MKPTPRSTALLAEACRVIPGGVNSPVRAFSAVQGDPPFIRAGQGVWITDEDDNRYIDLVGSWGPLIMGHAHPHVVQRVEAAVRQGSSFGAPTKAEVRFAELLCSAHPTLDQVRLCSSGTEATMHAIRLARGVTGRDKIVKIDGCYHGAHDAVLVKAGSGVATFARPGSPGIPDSVAALSKTAPFNDLDAIEAHLSGGDIAAVILEAVPGNMGCILPQPGFLAKLRQATQAAGTLLIIDEVMTGFRLARGGACAYFNIEADLVTLGKIVGGGFPLAAFGGSSAVMGQLSPAGPVYQAGTLSGNPVAVAAGHATLDLLTPEVYARLEALGAELERALRPSLAEASMSMSRVGSMFTLFFRPQVPTNFVEVGECEMSRFGRFHRAALERGVYLPPSQYEAVFLPAILTDDELGQIAASLSAAIAAV